MQVTESVCCSHTRKHVSLESQSQRSCAGAGAELRTCIHLRPAALAVPLEHPHPDSPYGLLKSCRQTYCSLYEKSES